ncbi:hypothetical protein BYT27DRAFT_7161810 [Phlegmacium glaucopus]|nr:hypothetical protein BYT27DRAFT_7161810 [Phlegmacium glaucopus]
MVQSASQSNLNQPKAAINMKVAKVSEDSATRHQQGHCEHQASRIRGGGAAKDCFLGAIGVFLCCEFCEGCCDCLADIICCPCEMCC